MPNVRTPIAHSANHHIPREVLRLIPRFSKRRRNEIRGAVGLTRKNTLTPAYIESIRNNSNERDMQLAGSLLEGPFGLKERQVNRLRQKDIWITYEGESKPLALELAYACGILNSWKSDTEKAIGTILLLSSILDHDYEDRCNAVKVCAKEWGASRFISYKIALLKSVDPERDPQSDILKDIDTLLGHDESPEIQYSAIENVLSSISLFSVAKRHTNTLKSKMGQNFRSRHSLSNLVATPFSEADASDFLRRNHETCLLDCVHAIWVILNLADRFPESRAAVERNLDAGLFEALETARSTVGAQKLPSIFQSLENQTLGNDDASLLLYRQSSIFLEFPEICRFRNDLDRVIGLRLISNLLPRIRQWPCNALDDIEVLKRPNSQFDFSKHNQEDVNIDVFYRTYLFLKFIQEPMNLAYITEEDIRFVFDNTIGLDSLLLESELQSMHLNAPEETKPLISVLALALYRARSSDPDIDYDYRYKLEQYILEKHAGSIPTFIESLTEDTPRIAGYLATSLDEPTLEKMYRLIHSAQDASMARRDILLAIGVALGRIEFIIEAEAIETRNKVGKLRQYFDTSRMFVDSIAMRDWLEANPSAYTQQYKELLPKLVTKLTAIAKFTDHETGESRNIPILEITSTIDQLVQQIANEAFREFCVNNEFGIESYLGRRIRHNTLHGVMINPIDAILGKAIYQPIVRGTEFGKAISSWDTYFRSYIERMRKEFLQFRSSSKPNAMFDPELDLTDSTTLRGIAQLSTTIQISGGEMLSDLIISYCWQQIGPQLDAASRRIKIQMAREIKSSLENHLERFEGPEEQKMFAELSQEVDNVFAKVAGWFRRPETGFVPASIKDICRIIDLEAGLDENLTIVRGNALDTYYYGISVHRLYDCLAVLIQNAGKHGDSHSPIELNCKSTEIPGTNLHQVEISVLSTVNEEEANDKIQRIKSALSAVETGRDMVTEGFSGLKKLKYITKLNEGQHTVEMANYENQVELRFRLKVEVTSSGGEDEENTSD